MLDAIFYTDLQQDERDVIVALESCEIKLDRLFNTYSALMEASEVNLREAELKCFEESGNIDDLEDYYREAEEKTAEQTEGIFSKIKQAIVNFFKGISNFFKGKKDKVANEGEVDAPKGLLGFVQKIGNAFKTGFSTIKAALLKHKKGVILGGAAVAVALAAFKFVTNENLDAVSEGNSTEKIKVIEAKNATQQLIEGADQLAIACEEVDDKKADKGTKDLLSRLKGIGAVMRRAGNKLLDYCGQIKDKFTGKRKGSDPITTNDNNGKVVKDYTNASDKDPNKKKRSDDKRGFLQRRKDRKAGHEGNEVGDNLKKIKDAERKGTHRYSREVLLSDYEKNGSIPKNHATWPDIEWVIKKTGDYKLAEKKDIEKWENEIRDLPGRDEYKLQFLKSKFHVTLEADEDEDLLLDDIFEESENDWMDETDVDFWERNGDAFVEDAAEIDDLLNELFIGESVDDD